MSVKPTKKKAKPATTTAGGRLRHLAVHEGKNILHFNPQRIEIIKGHNPRNFDTPQMRKRLDELNLSIAASGVLNPVCVLYDNVDRRAFLMDGETRLRACLELQAEGASDILIPGFQLTEPDVAKRTLHLLQANSCCPLTQLECGEGYKSLLNSNDSKWTVPDIAQKVGKTIRYVEEALELFDVGLQQR
jgi:hypothetical protein